MMQVPGQARPSFPLPNTTDHWHRQLTLLECEMLTIERLKQVIHYDPETGVFTRLECFQRPDVIGPCSLEDHGNGYHRITIDGKRYYRHRLAWFYMTGCWPVEVDHKNRNRTDNAWANLREVTSSGNKQNQRKAHSNSHSGRLGVSWDGTRMKWTARIRVGGSYKYLGRFVQIEQAEKAYLRAKQEHHIEVGE